MTIYKLSGSYTVKSAINTAKVLDIAGGSLRNGGNLQIWNSNGSAAQKYSFTLQSDDYFRITCTHNGKAPDVSGGSTSNGRNVWQYALNGTRAQKWLLYQY